MNNHEMSDSTMPTILGASQSSNTRPRTRPRYSYPASATEWTEYTSPLLNAKDNFVIDVVGDRSRQSGPSFNEPRDLSARKDPLNPVPAATAPAALTNSMSAVKEAQAGLSDATAIKLSAEQQHVLDLVRSGQKYVLMSACGQNSEYINVLGFILVAFFSQDLRVWFSYPSLYI